MVNVTTIRQRLNVLWATTAKGAATNVAQDRSLDSEGCWDREYGDADCYQDKDGQWDD